MAKAGYTVVTGGAISLTASTPKTVLAVKSGSAFGLDLTKVWWGFVDTLATEAPVTCELCAVTYATAGTSSSVTPVQIYGRTITAGFTASKNYTAEPTVLTTIGEIPLTPNGGTLLYDTVLGQSPDCAPDNGFALRFTAAADTSVRATMFVERL